MTVAFLENRRENSDLYLPLFKGGQKGVLKTLLISLCERERVLRYVFEF
jgi:hypothetical protein